MRVFKLPIFEMEYKQEEIVLFGILQTIFGEISNKAASVGILKTQFDSDLFVVKNMQVKQYFI